jgi:hypothetical protein
VDGGTDSCADGCIGSVLDRRLARGTAMGLRLARAVGRTRAARSQGQAVLEGPMSLRSPGQGRLEGAYGAVTSARHGIRGIISLSTGNQSIYSRETLRIHEPDCSPRPHLLECSAELRR